MKTKDTLKTVRIALAKYSEDRGAYPSEKEGLDALIGPYLQSDFALKDAWFRKFVYKHASTDGDSSESVIVYSIGANGLDENGAGDDISINGVDKE